MGRDDIIRMAREAGASFETAESMFRFAELVSAAEREACAKLAEAEANEIEALRAALSEIRDRLVDHPLYSPLTEDEEEDIGGDAAEFSYLVRVADAALEPQKVGDAEMQAGG